MMKYNNRLLKGLIGIGIMGLLLVIGGALKSYSTNNVTNKHDVENTKLTVGGAIELQKLGNEIQEKLINSESVGKSAETAATITINQSNNETAIELKKIELIEAQKLKNQFEMEKIKLNNKSILKKREIAEKIRKEKEEIDILKSIAN